MNQIKRINRVLKAIGAEQVKVDYGRISGDYSKAVKCHKCPKKIRNYCDTFCVEVEADEASCSGAVMSYMKGEKF